MHALRKATNRINALADRGSFERDLDDELKFHLEMETEKNVEQGMSPAAARAQAIRSLGPVEVFKDEVRDARGVTWMDDVGRDVRFGLRSLRRSPAFTLVAVLCLALGIGANAALFSVINAVLLRPLPYAEPDRLVRIYESYGKGQGSVSVPNFRDWRQQVPGFSQLAAWQPGSFNLQGDSEISEPAHLQAVTATANLFDVLGARPLRGRAFDPRQDRPGRDSVAVVSERLWHERFGADPSLVGRTLRLDGTLHTVIGIMPAAFDFPPGAAKTDVWTLFNPSQGQANNRGSHFLAVVGRLRQGVSMDQASAQLRDVAARLEKAYPDQQTGRSIVTYPLRETVVGRSRPALLILFGAVALVLLIACANVANLLLARAAVRRREVAIRLSLGASRSRLVRQFLVESLVLALMGAGLGTLLAGWSLSVLGPLAQSALPLTGGIPLDGRVFAFLLAAAVLSGLAFGLVPALQASKEDVRDTLSEAGKSTASSGQQRFRSALVVGEIALSLVLLIGAGLLLRGFLELSGTEPGLAANNVLTAHVAVPADRLNGSALRFFQPALEKIRHIPGVRSAAVVSMLPIQNAWTNGGYKVEGRPDPPADQWPIAEWRVASPQFFQTLGIPILRGRDFTDQDGGPGKRLVIINDALARRDFPGENAVGRQLRIDKDAPHTIVGVVGSVRQAGLDLAPLPEIYFPHTQIGAEDWLFDATLVVRTASARPESVASAVREAVKSVDPSLPLFQVMSMEDVISDSLASRRLNLWLLAIFAGMALVLSAAGLYGVISYLVAQRTREIGVRIALGAQTRDVLRLIMGQGANLTAAGIVLGLVGALAFTRVLESLLYGVSARDPLTFASIAALLALVALAATWLPARRAARVDPMIAIRNE